MKFSIFIIVCMLSSALWGQKFHTEFAYENITIQNSYPKGGRNYMRPNGNSYTYVIFWTRITNDTDKELQVKFNLPNDSFTIPSSPRLNFYFYLPNRKMILEKEPLPDYGLDLQAYLDENWNVSSDVIKTILPNTSYLFYHVALSDKGVNGVVRSGFELQDKILFYKINDLEINCGSIKFPD